MKKGENAGNMPVKNVAVIVPYLHSGGAERMAANLSLELQKKYNVYMIVFTDENITYEYGGTLINIAIPPILEKDTFCRIKNALKRAIRIRKIKKQYHIDCAISHMDGANLVNVLSRRKDKIISVYHSMPSQKMTKSKYNLLMQRLIGKLSDKYVFVSRLAEHDAVHSFEVDKNRTTAIYNFCDVKKQMQQAECEIEDKAAQDFFERHQQVFVNMGRLLRLKGQRHFIKAFAKVKIKYPNSGIMILGEGEEEENLRNQVEALGLEQDVFMPGNVRNPFPYLKRADAFVLSSEHEGLPMVLIEAASCGCPIISTDMPSGAREVLAPDTDILHVATEKEYGKYGILVPVCNEEAEGMTAEEQTLADAMIEILENRELRDMYIAKSAECAKRFSAETVMQQWIELIGG